MLDFRNCVAFESFPGFCSSPPVQTKTNIGLWWNDTDRVKTVVGYSDKNLSQCCFLHHRTNMAIEPRSVR